MRKIFFILLIALLLISFSGCILLYEKGSLQNPYLVSTAEDLDNVRLNLEAHYKQIADIDLSEYENWDPIGNYIGFSGSYNGYGFKINNLKSLNRIDNVGLFSIVRFSGVIENVVIENTDIIANRSCAGGIAGYNYGKISNSKVTGNITGNSYVGGIVGRNSGNISECYTEILVEANNYVGGLIGQNRGVARNNNSYGKINASSRYVGGLIGQNSGRVENNISNAEVSGAWDYVGGLIGQNSGRVKNNVSSGKVIGLRYVGGLIGLSEENIIKSNYSDVTVTGSDYIGGLVGRSKSPIENSYALGDVFGLNYIGGLVGYNDLNHIINSYSNNNVTGRNYLGGFVGYNFLGAIKNCYSTGEIKSLSEKDEKGAFLGFDYYKSGVIENSYYDLEKCEIYDEYAIGKSSIEMKKKETFVGWDFETIWDIVENETYPFFKYEK
jgi:hypothetical protein